LSKPFHIVVGLKQRDKNLWTGKRVLSFPDDGLEIRNKKMAVGQNEASK
jgi:hypothetical protein